MSGGEGGWEVWALDFVANASQNIFMVMLFGPANQYKSGREGGWEVWALDFVGFCSFCSTDASQNIFLVMLFEPANQYKSGGEGGWEVWSLGSLIFGFCSTSASQNIYLVMLFGPANQHKGGGEGGRKVAKSNSEYFCDPFWASQNLQARTSICACLWVCQWLHSLLCLPNQSESRRERKSLGLL